MKKLFTNLCLMGLLSLMGGANAWAQDPSFTEVAKGIYTLDDDDSGQLYSKKEIDLGQKLEIEKGKTDPFVVNARAPKTPPTGFTNASDSRYQASIVGSSAVTLDFTFPKTSGSYVITNIPHGIDVNYNDDNPNGGTLTCTVNNAVPGSYIRLTYKVGAATAIDIADATEQYAWYSYDSNSDKLSFDLKSRKEYYLYTKAEIYSPIDGEIGNCDDLTKEHYDFIVMKGKTGDASTSFFADHKTLFCDRFSSDYKSGQTVGVGTTGLFFNGDGSKLTVKNLKKGDKITFNHTKGRIQVSAANCVSGKYIANSPVSTITGNVAQDGNLIPGEVYTVLKDVDFSVYAKRTVKNSDDEKYTDSEGKTQKLTAGNLEISSIIITHATTLDPIKLNAYGYATRYLTDPVDVSCLTKMKAWIATSCENGELTFTEVKKIPANCGVLLAGKPDWTFVPAYASESDNVSTNIFKGVTASAAPTLVTGESAYVLNGDTFKKVPENGKITANRAYLALTEAQVSSPSGIAAFNFIPYEDEETGIESVEEAPVAQEGYYTLTGIRVEKPTHGIYIFNGKKIFIK